METTNTGAIEKIASDIRELEGILESVVANDTAILDALSQFLSALHQMQVKSEQNQTKVAEELGALTIAIQQLEARARGHASSIVVQPDRTARENPEDGLLEFLFSFMSDRNAIDVGANTGRVSEHLLNAGYSVYAFEPFQQSFETLNRKLEGNKNFRAFNYAVGSEDRTMMLHIASDTSGEDKFDATLFHSLVEHPMLEDCSFITEVPVKVRSLESLRQSGEIPPTAGILKIDTEGFDLNVIKGMGDGGYSVVMTEFWDASHPFGRGGHGRLEDLVVAMKRRGYNWHIVIYRVDESSTISFFCNRLHTVANSWGNVLFFNDHEVFSHALQWCSDILVPTLHA